MGLSSRETQLEKIMMNKILRVLVVIVILILIAWAGDGDFDEEERQAKYYKHNVCLGVWPDYKKLNPDCGNKNEN